MAAALTRPYRERADELRREAKRIQDLKIREEFEQIAREYEALAKALELDLLGR